MLQVKIVKPREIRYEDIDNPRPKPDEAIITVGAVGICGSDMHIYLGKNPGISPPHVSGHEFGGFIKELGSRSPSLKIGDKVVVNPVINCGECYYCKNSMEHMCDTQVVIGGQIEGAMAEEIAVPIKNIIKLPDSFSIIQAPMIEPVTVCIHCLQNIMNSTVLIVGLGTVGLIGQQMCMMNGNKVVGTDISDFSLKMSKNLGADLTVSFSHPGRDLKIQDFLGEEKIDLVIDTVCSKETLDFCTKIVRKKGKIIIIGIPEKNFETNILNILFKEITLLSGSLYLDSEFEKAAQTTVDKKIEVKRLITKTFALDRAKEGFEYKLNNPCIKVVLTNV
jgi:L-gulonate 5-dehydrogenase